MVLGLRGGLENTKAVGRYEKKGKEKAWAWIRYAFLDAMLAEGPLLDHNCARQFGLRVVRDYESPRIRPRGLGIQRC